jgi:hypothetical protein
LALFALAFRKNQAPPVAFQTTEQDSEWIENNELTDNAKEKFSAKAIIVFPRRTRMMWAPEPNGYFGNAWLGLAVPRLAPLHQTFVSRVVQARTAWRHSRLSISVRLVPSPKAAYSLRISVRLSGKLTHYRAAWNF